MRTLQFRANVLVCVLFMALCVFLYKPTTELLDSPVTDGLGPGVIPMACLCGMFFLSAYVLGLSIMKYRACPPRERAGDGRHHGVPERAFLGISLIAIFLIAAYAFLWKFTHFALASSVFSCVMAVFVLPPEERKAPKIIKYCIGLVCFSLLVWLAFENLLKVSLR